RAFLDALAADPANDKSPNVKAYIAAHPPARWNKDWSIMLPEGWEEGQGTYTVTDPTTNLVFPGNDQEALNRPVVGGFSIKSGTFTIDTGLNFQMGSPHFFPEFVAAVPPWTD